MKRCPKCKHPYPDEPFSTCPDDGEMLVTAAEFAGADTLEMEPEELLVRAAEAEQEGRQK